MKPARQIVKPTTHRSVGIVNVSWLQEEGIPHESDLERAFILCAAVSPAVRSIASQPFEIDWYDTDGELHAYVPDYLVRLVDGASVIVEVRPLRFIAKDTEKFNAASAVLRLRHIDFAVISDRELCKTRQQAVTLMLRDARGQMDDFQLSSARGLVESAGSNGLLWADALSSGIPAPAWNHLRGRRILVADSGIEITTSSRLYLRHDWPGGKEHERLQFDRWFGIEAWQPDV